MLAGAFPNVPFLSISTKRKTLPIHSCFPFPHHRRITESLPALSFNFRYRLVHNPPSRFARMASLLSSTALPSNLTELRDEADFESILTPEGHLSVCGFERSARSTFPNFKNFRVAFLPGFRRVFAHIAPIFYERGIAKEETKEVSSLSVEPWEGEGLIVTVFEIERSEIPSFIERENEFRFLAIVPEDLAGAPFTNSAVVCACYSDEEYFQIRCKGNKDIYFQNYGRYNIHKIWRDDVLPCRVYLRHCVLAAKNLGEAAYDNFLDHTFLSDRKTTIREYLSSTGSGIMQEIPPEALKSRYGG
ncbi:uncharacterized protein LOC110038996 isoform X2 [Phalaenopsis equestris]|uniref:uncharacterized protein LOC110038996 isoform X2 n=1 Tax=Phalaenopsis equestris TaxID=78828 RepID=UPI0009E2452D|nr:uncharacterized protein LOC110038996 isoform X2 [Phalaenopsis equestris]